MPQRLAAACCLAALAWLAPCARAWAWPAGIPAQTAARARPGPGACPLRPRAARRACLRAAPGGGGGGADSGADSGAKRGQEEGGGAGPFKAGKSRYEAFYEGQGAGGADGAIDTTAEDVERCDEC